MATVVPRVQAPQSVARDEVFEVKTLISHPMETGLRRDDTGLVIPRRIINRLTCRYNDVVVFSLELHEAMAANPYVAFHVRAAESGRLELLWEEDGGAVFSLASPIVVRA